MTESKIEPKKKVEIEILRKDGKTFFKFKVDPKIEEYYKKHSADIKESESWPGLKFYVVPILHDDPEYQNQLDSFRLFDNYGTSLFKNKAMNVAWMRTVGGQGEIEIKSSMTFADLSLLFKNVLDFLKSHIENTFREFKIKGSLTVEI